MKKEELIKGIKLRITKVDSVKWLGSISLSGWDGSKFMN